MPIVVSGAPLPEVLSSARKNSSPAPKVRPPAPLVRLKVETDPPVRVPVPTEANALPKARLDCVTDPVFRLIDVSVDCRPRPLASSTTYSTSPITARPSGSSMEMPVPRMSSVRKLPGSSTPACAGVAPATSATAPAANIGLII